MELQLPTRTVTINEACDLAGVSRRTLYNWIAAGKLQYVRTAGGSIRTDPTSLFRDGEAPQGEQ